MNQATHLLVIEDGPAVAYSLRDGLEREGYAVTWTTSGAAGVQYARDQNPHRVILDVRLPDGSGFDHMHRLREKSSWAARRYIMAWRKHGIQRYHPTCVISS